MDTKYFHFKAFDHGGFFLLIILDELQGENSEDQLSNTLVLLRLFRA